MGFFSQIKQAQFDFIGRRRAAMTISAVLCALIVLGIALFGFNWGVDFAGGSEIEVQFAGKVDVANVRKAVEAAGFKAPLVQEVGGMMDNTFLIRIGSISTLSHEDAQKAEAAVRAKFGDDISVFTFNPNYGDKFEIRFQKGKSEGAGEGLRAAIEGLGIHVQDIRHVADGYSVMTAGISEKVAKELNDAAARNELKPSELHRVEFVGPQVGEQLRNQGILAVFYAAIAILLYIAFRFELRFAPGAVVAILHDVIMVLGYYLVTRHEFNLTSVAVLLTIVGYSVNDTIVVYDRIRENSGKLRGMNLAALMNLSLNQTMTRTIRTSVTTIVAVVGLILFGIGQLTDFAIAMILGVLVGTYSSIFIAIPLSLMLENVGKKPSAQSKALATPGKSASAS